MARKEHGARPVSRRHHVPAARQRSQARRIDGGADQVPDGYGEPLALPLRQGPGALTSVLEQLAPKQPRLVWTISGELALLQDQCSRYVRPMNHNHQTLIGVLAWDGFLTSEVVAPVEVLGAAVDRGLLDARVQVVASEATPVTSAEGLRILPDVTIDECPTLDVLIVSGSAEMDGPLADARLVDFVARQGKGARYLASNCSAAFLVGKAGLLDGRRVTTYRGGEADLQDQFPEARVSPEDVVVDGSLISSSGEVVSYEAALVLLAELAGQEAAKRIAEDLYIR